MPTKEEIRKMVANRKQSLDDTHEKSRQVMTRLLTLSDMQNCSIVMTYVDFGKEVRTVPLISELFNQRKHIVVPYVVEGEIQLFRLNNLKELAPGYFGILEPKIELRNLSDRRVKADELQLILVPGVAFDPQCGRLGRGMGFYDRFLKKTPENTLKIGLAFDLQIFDAIPMSDNDLFVDVVVTENHLYFRNLLQ